MRSALKNRVHALIARQGIRHEHSDLFGRAGLPFLARLELREPPRRRLDSLLALIADFDREIAATTREVDQRATSDDRVAVLCQIRGVGPYTAMLVIAEIGDIARFARARKLCARAGLTPTVRSSDGKARLGHITRQGSRPLRWALVEAAQHSVRGGGPLRQDFERIAKRRGKKTAKVAVAREILTLRYYGLRDGEIRCPARRCRPAATAVMAASSRGPPTWRRRRRRARCGRSGELAICHGLPTERTAAHSMSPRASHDTAARPGLPDG
jgi:transposase